MAQRIKKVRASVTIGGVVYGARPDAAGPIGGGRGYRRIVPGGRFVVRTLDELLEALKRAKAGQVVFIPGDVEIDCTTRVHIEQLVLEVRGGVTLASDRGRRGSPGALIRSGTFATRPLIRVTGPRVRVSGLRIVGPDPERRMEHHARSFTEEGGRRGHEYYYKFPVSDGVLCDHAALEVDNCELSGFSLAAVHLLRGQGHRIHHCFIHHNQYNGLGYGVAIEAATARIDHNLFDFNRHSIAGTGQPPSGYEACDNVELGESLSHCFDMHGGRDRKDGTNAAASWLMIHHNTFKPDQPAVWVRGEPRQGAVVHHNWFAGASKNRPVRAAGGTRAYANAVGRSRPRVAAQLDTSE